MARSIRRRGLWVRRLIAGVVAAVLVLPSELAATATAAIVPVSAASVSPPASIAEPAPTPRGAGASSIPSVGPSIAPLLSTPPPTAVVPDVPAEVADFEAPDTGTPGRPAAGSHVPVAVELKTGEVARVAPAARARSLPVRVETLAAADVAKVGGQKLAFRVSRRDTNAGVAGATVTVDYSVFRDAFGGDWAGRLGLVILPACRETLGMGAPGCDAAPIPLVSTNDPVSGTVTAQLDLPGAVRPAGAAGGLLPSDTGVNAPTTAGAASPTAATPSAAAAPASVAAPKAVLVALAASTSSSYGDFSAAPLAPLSSWQVGLQTGGFSWNYPIPAPAAIAGPAPSLSLGYNSQAIDSMTAQSNTQGSWVGAGWELNGLGYIQRSYRACRDVQNSSGAFPYSIADECWWGDNASVTLNGVSTELIKDSSSGVWRAKDDVGWRVDKLTGATNGDSGDGVDGTGEYWRITTTDGTQYYFGVGLDRTGTVSTNSTFTVPVYGLPSAKGTGPCYNAANLPGSWCQQAWRWNLDLVVDPNLNEQVIYWAQELNSYARYGTPGYTTSYVRAGFPTKIEYSRTYGQPATGDRWAEVRFTSAYRCVVQSGGCAAPTSTSSATNYPDIPTDQICSASCNGSTNGAPTFFTTQWLQGIDTVIWHGSGWQTIDHFDLAHSYPTPPAQSPADSATGVLKAWLINVVRTARPGTADALMVGGSAATNKGVSFSGTALKNRADSNTGNGVPPMALFRLNQIEDEWGGLTTVNYGQPVGCSPLPANGTYNNNVKDCFPQLYAGQWVTFNKWLVLSVVRSDLIASQPPVTTTYTYEGTPAWHYGTSDFIRPASHTYDDFRGYQSVIVDAGGVRRRTGFFRGMYDDVSSGAGSAARATSVYSWWYGTLPDRDWFAGRILDEYVLDSGGALYSGSFHQYTGTQLGSNGTVASIRTLETDTIGYLAGTYGRTTHTVTDYTSFGTPSLVHEYGDTATASDDRCTWYSYTPNTGSWIVDKPFRVARYDSAAGACNGNLIADETFAYDQPVGSVAYSTTPSRGNVTAHTVSGAGTTFSAYDAYGRPTLSRDARGYDTTTAYTPASFAGYVTGVIVTNPKTHTTNVTLDPLARNGAIRLADANSNVTEASYDGLGRLRRVWLPTEPRASWPNSPSTEYLYSNDKTSYPWQETNTLTAKGSGPSYTLSMSYMTGRLEPYQTQTRTPGGRSVATSFYDTAGRLTRQTFPYGDSSDATTNGILLPPAATSEHRYSYGDAMSRLTGDAAYAGSSGSATLLWNTTKAYSGVWTSSFGADSGQWTEQSDDAFGKLSRTIEHNGSELYNTTYGYDHRSQLASITDANSNVTTYTYDLAGRRTASSDPDQGAWIFGFDANGNVTDRTDATGSKVVTIYDQLNRPTYQRLGSTTGTVLASWTYDAAGQLGLVDRTDSYTLGQAYTVDYGTYDPRNRPLSKTVKVPTSEGAIANGGAGWTTSYTYDAAVARTTGYPAAGAMPAETVTTSYYGSGQPYSMSGSYTYINSSTFDPLGRPSARVEGSLSGSNLTRTWNWEPATGRLASIEAYKNATTVSTVASAGRNEANGTRAQLDIYGYDPAGNITKIMDWGVAGGNYGQEQCFTYDLLNRLTRAYTNSFPSNASGEFCNGTAQTNGVNPYDANYTYDPIGNMTSGPNGTYSNGNEFSDPTQIGTGWNGYDVYAPGDWNRDSYPDLLARDATGALFLYPGTGTGFAARTQIGTGWTGYDVYTPGDWNRDGYPDLLARDATGALFLYPGNGTGFGTRSQIGTGWTGYYIIGPGDWNGDAFPDLLARDSTGVLWLYPGNGTGFGARTQAGSGWSGYDSITGTGDLNGDGKPDLVTRDSGSGIMRLYMSNGTGTWNSPFSFVFADNWTGYDRILGPGDWNRDGRNDLIVRAPSGALYLVQGQGKNPIRPHAATHQGSNSYTYDANGSLSARTVAGSSTLAYYDPNLRLQHIGNPALPPGGGAANPARYQTGDFNGDGKKDLISFESNRNFYVWLSTGTGYASPLKWGGNGADLDPARYQTGDFNGDGKTDVVSFESNGGIYVWLSNGTNGFNPVTKWAQNGADLGPTRYRVGDFNGDGKTDVVSFETTGGIYIWLSNGTTAFAAGAQWGVNGASVTPDRYKVADLNGDNKTDVISFESNGGIYVWLSNGVNAFNAYTRWALNGGDIGVDRYQFGDFNGDGKKDLISFETNGGLYVWLSTGTAFGTAARWALNGADIGSARYFVTDLDNDTSHKTDVISIETNGGIYAWMSTGTTFATPAQWATNPAGDLGGARYRVTDTNLDSRGDVISLENTGIINVWTSTGTGLAARSQWGLNSDTTNSYIYDADGQRLIRNDNGTKTIYLGEQVITATTGITKVDRYYRLGTTLVAQRQATPTTNELYWIALNHQGTLALTQQVSTANLTYQRNLPYGGQLGGNTITTSDRGFLGETEDDTTNLDYLNNRYYDPNLARFTSVDPLVAATRDPYGYGHSNPVTYTDPTGLDPDNQGSCGGYVSNEPCQKALEGAQASAGAARYGPNAGTAQATYAALENDLSLLRSPPLPPSGPQPVYDYHWKLFPGSQADASALFERLRANPALYFPFQVQLANCDAGDCEVPISKGNLLSLNGDESSYAIGDVTVESASGNAFLFLAQPGHIGQGGTIRFRIYEQDGYIYLQNTAIVASGSLEAGAPLLTRFAGKSLWSRMAAAFRCEHAYIGQAQNRRC